MSGGPASPLATAVIVNYDVEAFLPACLRRVLSTLNDRLEVVLVDTASTDGSLAAVAAAFPAEPRLRVVRNAGVWGPAVGRNVGLRHARGGFLVFLYNDVEVAPGWLHALLERWPTT